MLCLEMELSLEAMRLMHIITQNMLVFTKPKKWKFYSFLNDHQILSWTHAYTCMTKPEKAGVLDLFHGQSINCDDGANPYI